jgi:hypothetical protein
MNELFYRLFPFGQIWSICERMSQKYAVKIYVFNFYMFLKQCAVVCPQ